MENNEIVETNEAPIEETQKPVVDEVEDVADDIPTLEDYERLRKEKETLIAQKEHWRKKAEEKKLESAPNKPNNPDMDIIRQEAILYAKGYTEDEVALAMKIAKVNEVPVLKAIDDEYLKAVVAKRQQKELSEKASLSPSGSSFVEPKNYGEMSKDEHKQEWLKAIGAA